MAYLRSVFPFGKHLLYRNPNALVGFCPGWGPKQTKEVHFSGLNKKNVEEIKHHISFSDCNTAFKDKTTNEIIRALFVLKLCSYDAFVNRSLKIMTVTERILGEKLFGALIRPTFYNQFVGGDDEQSLANIIHRLQKNNIKPMIACMLEDDENGNLQESQMEKKYENNFQRILNCIDLLGRIGNNPALQLKITGLIPVKLLVKMNPLCTETNFISLVHILADCMKEGTLQSSSILKPLDEKQKIALRNGLVRLQCIAQFSREKNVILLIDAEYLSMRNAINAMAIAMMKNHNEENALVWNTVQCYFKEAFNIVNQEVKAAEHLNICYGVKIVRGAYMDREKQLAAELNYPDPLNSSYEKTGEMYNRVAEFMLMHIREVGSRCKIVLATHNEDAIHHALNKIYELNLQEMKHLISFGQLYGMCDQVTCPLSQSGWSVYKSIPFGSTSEVLPYLYRRATENRAVIKGSRKERELLRKELRHRIFV